MLLAVDFGGIYHWSQYVAAIGVLVAAVLAVAGLTDSTASSGLMQHRLLIPLGLLVGWAWFQSISMPAGLVSWISPGSHEAYTRWLEPFLDASEVDAEMSVSVSPGDTAHVAALLTILLPLCWAGSIVFHGRNRLKMLLSAIAIAGASVAILGFYRKLDPTADLWIFRPKATSFAGFVNRNNAALMLNLGLAASLGLLSWRMMALHQIELDDPDFEFNDLVALISDRESLTGLLSGTCCSAGLLINGSRGGLVAAIFGLVLAFGYVRPRRGLLSIPVLFLVLAASVAILVTPMQLNLESLQRMELISAEADTLQSDGRLTHWQDGWKAAMAYLPGGSGVSTYGYAYLPYQDASAGAWFEHADNLWLEMFVETGAIGVLVAAMMLGFLLISVNRLALSVDPLDQGLRVACWYMIAAVVVSQFFDFGLAMPANLFAVVLLSTAVVSRDFANGGASAVIQDHGAFDTPEPEKPRIRLKAETRNGVSWSLVSTAAVAIAASVVGWLVMPRLRDDAIAQSMLNRLRDEYTQWRLNPDSLEKMEEVLVEQLSIRPTPYLYAQLATVQKDRGRLIESLEWKPRTTDELSKVFAQTSLVNRELPYPPKANVPRRGNPPSYRHYLNAWQTCLASLADCPLAQAPRGDLLRLKPIVFHERPGSGNESLALVPNSAQSPETMADHAVEHLTTFYGGNPQRLMTLGTESLLRGDLTRAETAFRRALTTNPNYATEVMNRLKDFPDADVVNAIPETSEAMKRAAASYLSWQNPDPRFLRRCLEIIRCHAGESMSQRSACEALRGKIYFFLESPEKGIEAYLSAIRFAPDQANFRLELIDYLLSQGRTAEAMAQARLGRTSLPDNPRFQKVVDQIAESDRKRLTESSELPQIDPEQIEAILNP
ncbi:O-Antigen ligase [Neorhodopirellula pilleata]|uniref:O-Antigen ligase n=2 Tax=Neorhodopirellula pilleata TaxID=2714738 RepID=A0A5C6AQK4_9BACT|nr:O-Antigen ligase [Neorhodopirellula pilleata]